MQEEMRTKRIEQSWSKEWYEWKKAQEIVNVAIKE